MRHEAVNPFVILLVMVVLTSCAFAQEGEDETGGSEVEADRRLSVQMYSLRDYGPLEEQLALVADEGFSSIETVGEYGTQGVGGEELSALLERYGLRVISSHVNLGYLEGQLDEVIDRQKALGNDTVVMPFLSGSERPTTGSEWRDLGARLDSIGQRLRQEDMQLAYHNHDFELVEVDGMLALEHLFAGASPDNLMWQADVAWIDRAGVDPAELLQTHGERLLSIHAKDNAPPGENSDQGGFADVGHGVLDWEAILEVTRDLGVDRYIVEHDNPADHRQTLRRAREYLTGRLGEAQEEMR